MKKIFLVLVMLFVTTMSYAQFDMTSSLGFGAEVNSKLDYTLYQASASVTLQQRFDELTIGEQTTSLFNDSVTTFLTGLVVGYDVYRFDTNKVLSVNASSLYSSEGDMFYGGGVKFRNKNVEFSLSGYQNYDKKTFVGVGSVGWYLLR